MSRFIAIDVDAGGLFVTAGTARGHTVRVEHALPVVDDPRPLTPDSAPALAAKLKEALAAARVPNAPVLICVGRDRVVLKDIRHPKTAPAEEPAVVRFQAQRDLAEPPDALHLDYVPTPAPEGAEDKRATAVFVRKDLYNAARTLCEQAGLKLTGFTPRPYASVAAVRHAVATGVVPPPDTPNSPVAALSLWDGGGEFVVYRGDHLMFSRSVSAMALNSEAALVGEAKRSLAAFATQHPRERIETLYLSEGHSNGGSWAARLQQALPLTVHPLDPLVGSPAADTLPPHLHGRFTAAAGLLAAAAGPLPINFVSPRQPRAEPSKARSWVMIAFLVLLLVGGGIAGGMYFLHTDLDRKEQMAKIALKNAEDAITNEQLNANRVKAIEEFRARSVNWLDLYYDVAAVTPNVDRVRVKEFKGTIREPKVEAKKPASGGGSSGSSKFVAGPDGKVTFNPTAAKSPVAAAPAKPKTPDPVADLQLDLVANSSVDDPLLIQVRDMFLDGKYFGKADMSTRQTTKREATIRAELLPRKPTQYTRVLRAEFPKLPPAPPKAEEPPAFDEGDLP